MFDEPYIGTIIPFAGAFLPNPEKWLFCNGQLLQIAQFQALYTIIGDTYGGDGRTTFALPDLCGRVAVHAGEDSHKRQYTMGETGGNEKVYINTNNLPPHNHSVIIEGKPKCSFIPGHVDTPDGHCPATVSGSPSAYSTVTSDPEKMAAFKRVVESPVAFPPHVQEPFPAMSPYCTMNYIICHNGLYPPHDQSD